MQTLRRAIILTHRYLGIPLSVVFVLWFVTGIAMIYVGGMPTAEVFAAPYYAAGVTTYSSAVYNFIPNAALAFYGAMLAGDTKVTSEMLTRFFYPYLSIRNRAKG